MINLKDITVIVTRPMNQSVKLTQLISRCNGASVLCPSIEIQGLLNEEQLRERWSELLPADGVIFVSANAVRLGLKNITAGILAQTHVLAVGSATAHSLKRKGLQHVLVPTDIFNSEALLKLPELNDVASKQFVIVRGKNGREHLEVSLLQRGAKVDSLECYQCAIPTLDPALLEISLKNARNPVLSFTSVTAAKNFTQMTKDMNPLLADKLKHMPIVVFSERIRAAVEKELRYRGPVAVAPKASDESLVKTISEIMQNPNLPDLSTNDFYRTRQPG